MEGFEGDFAPLVDAVSLAQLTYLTQISYFQQSHKKSLENSNKVCK